jgi:GT2 family glycosyltransferase
VTSAPPVAIILPAYESAQTIRRSLRCLARQTVRSFEVYVVDSSPSDATAEIVRTEFPWVRLLRAKVRLLPHAARRVAIEVSTAPVLVFTDPDAYAIPDWLERLLAAHRRWGGPVAGGVACYGNRWIDIGIHWRKFGAWVPGGRERWMVDAPSVNLLVPRRLLAEVGGIRGDLWLGDVLLTRSLAAAGWPTRFVPQALVYHHHLSGVSGLLRERFVRGRELARVRVDEERWSRLRIGLWLAMTVFPVRFLRAVLRDIGHARRARTLPRLLATLPVSQMGTLAALAGEVVAYLAAERRRRSATGASRLAGALASSARRTPKLRPPCAC